MRYVGGGLNNYFDKKRVYREQFKVAVMFYYGRLNVIFRQLFTVPLTEKETKDVKDKCV